jgi:NitT/TauT family transport system permease protein
VQSGAGTAATRGTATKVALAIGVPIAGLVVFVLLWLAWIELFVDSSSFLADWSPRLALPELRSLLASGDLNRHMTASVKRIVVGLGIATAIGIPLGMALGGFRIFNLAVSPVTAFLRMVSPLSWTPLAIILFGVGDSPVYFLIAIGAVWPITLSTAAGVSALDRDWLMLSRSLGATRPETLRTIVWPGIRNEVLTGIRLGMTTAWIILVPAEMLGVDSGLGFFILDARDRFNYEQVVSAIIVIGMIGIILDRIAHYLLTPRRRERTRSVAVSSMPQVQTGAVARQQYRI